MMRHISEFLPPITGHSSSSASRPIAEHGPVGARIWPVVGIVVVYAILCAFAWFLDVASVSAQTVAGASTNYGEIVTNPTTAQVYYQNVGLGLSGPIESMVLKAGQGGSGTAAAGSWDATLRRCEGPYDSYVSYGTYNTCQTIATSTNSGAIDTTTGLGEVHFDWDLVAGAQSSYSATAYYLFAISRASGSAVPLWGGWATTDSYEWGGCFSNVEDIGNCTTATSTADLYFRLEANSDFTAFGGSVRITKPQNGQKLHAYEPYELEAEYTFENSPDFVMWTIVRQGAYAATSVLFTPIKSTYGTARYALPSTMVPGTFTVRARGMSFVGEQYDENDVYTMNSGSQLLLGDANGDVVSYVRHSLWSDPVDFSVLLRINLDGEVPVAPYLSSTSIGQLVVAACGNTENFWDAMKPAYLFCAMWEWTKAGARGLFEPTVGISQRFDNLVTTATSAFPIVYIVQSKELVEAQISATSTYDKLTVHDPTGAGKDWDLGAGIQDGLEEMGTTTVQYWTRRIQNWVQGLGYVAGVLMLAHIIL